MNKYEGCNLVLYLANSHGEVLVTINLANLYQATLAMLAILPAIEDAWRRAPAPLIENIAVLNTGSRLNRGLN